MDIDDEVAFRRMVRAARARGKAAMAAPGRLVGVGQAPEGVVLRFQSGAALTVPQALWEAQLRVPEQRACLPEAMPLGEGVMWPDTEVGLHIPTFLLELLGSPELEATMRVHFARQAASVTSEKRQAAARRNGARGGRPRKATTEPSPGE